MLVSLSHYRGAAELRLAQEQDVFDKFLDSGDSASEGSRLACFTGSQRRQLQQASDRDSINISVQVINGKAG